MVEQRASNGGAAPPEVQTFFDKYRAGMSVMLEGAQADTGRTPKEVVWTKNKAKLYRYEPAAEKKYPVPILMVYALINRPYVLDLVPGNSLIEFLIGEGFDVYLLDWGIPGDEDKDLDFENNPGEMIDTGNRMLKPVTNYVGTYVNMWERIFEDKPMETWLAMNKWVNDGPPFPGATFKTWIKEFYQRDKLVQGEINLRGRRIDLSKIQVPLLSIAGKKDHICTLPQAEALMDLVGSEEKEFFVLDAGHVGLLTGRGAKKGLWPKVREWLSERSGA